MVSCRAGRVPTVAFFGRSDPELTVVKLQVREGVLCCVESELLQQKLGLSSTPRMRMHVPAGARNTGVTTAFDTTCQ